MSPKDKPVILIADDSRVVRVSLKNILKNDCQLIEAEDGQQAWEQLLETPDIRLIFSDLSMPRLDGRGLLGKIRNSEITRIRNLPFIVVTGNEEDSAIRDELQEMGATEVVCKPFDPARIVSFLSTLVSPTDSESYMLLPNEQEQSEFLPGVSNQNDFMLSASKELSFAIRNKNELAIALLRIDQFADLSTHYSEPAIQHILLTTTEIVRKHIHPDDTMAYFGEGLFAILRPASNAIGTRYIGRRILEDLIAKQFYLGESEELVSVSIGISAPQIKPGIRLRELLLLAEGRLKAAMDLGGNRVIDKGNDTLTPVDLASDSAPGMSRETELSSSLHIDSFKSSHLQFDNRLEHTSPSRRVDVQELEDKVGLLQTRLESLTHENHDLQSQVERLRKQSGESEQLRQRVFELESEQQHMAVKQNEIAEQNRLLQKRAEEAEEALSTQTAEEDEKNLTLQQANQFYEQENLRLEGQLEALNNRAQKAELGYRKSEQLVISLKDNIKLLRAQMEQIQQQLEETQQQAASAPPPSATEPDSGFETVGADDASEGSYLEEQTDSSLTVDGFPSSRPIVAEKGSQPAPVIQLFSEPSAPSSELNTRAEPPSAPTSEAPPKPLEQEPQPELSIPVYRVPPRERDAGEPRQLSSFTIASMILVFLLALGAGYFYFYWESDPTAVAGEPVEQQPSPRISGKNKPQTVTDKATNSASTTTRENAPVAELETSAAAKPVASAEKAPVSTEQQRPAPMPLAINMDEEARLQAELTLRQLAEEEFQRRLQQVGNGGVLAIPQAAGTPLDYDEQGEVSDSIVESPALAPEEIPTSLPKPSAAAGTTDNVQDQPASTPPL